MLPECEYQYKRKDENYEYVHCAAFNHDKRVGDLFGCAALLVRELCPEGWR